MRYGRFSYSELMEMDILELKFWLEHLTRLLDEEGRLSQGELS